MIEDTCPTCGGKVLRPDPPSNTKDENIALRKEWDAQYERGQRDG